MWNADNVMAHCRAYAHGGFDGAAQLVMLRRGHRSGKPLCLEADAIVIHRIVPVSLNATIATCTTDIAILPVLAIVLMVSSPGLEELAAQFLEGVLAAHALSIELVEDAQMVPFVMPAN